MMILMNKILILVAALMVGCGEGPPAIGEIVQVCESSIGTLFSERPVDCEAFETGVQNARSMLHELGLVPGQDFDTGFKGLRIHLLMGKEWFQNGDGYDGNYDMKSKTITLAGSGTALLHELLHHWDLIHFNVFTSSHMYWERNGYSGADVQYAKNHPGF